MTLHYTVNAFIIMLIAASSIYSIVQAFEWGDRASNHRLKLSNYNCNYAASATRCITGVLVIGLLILTLVFIESNNLIP